MAQALSEADVIKMIDSLSNWGRWGTDDQLGTINLITAESRRRAARLVSDGVSVTCARPISTDIAADTTFQPMRFMVDSGEGRDACSPERQLQRRGASEFIGMVFHGYTITHVDTPAHYFWNGRSTTAAPATSSRRARAPRWNRSTCFVTVSRAAGCCSTWPRSGAAGSAPARA